MQSLIQQLEAGHSDALTAYLNAISRFHSYSFGNILEIARQKPDATRVAGLYAWNQLGRKVRKGEKGIRILAPIIGVRRKKQEEAEKDIAKQNEAALVGFRSAYVFDRLSRDLCPARARPVSRTTPAYRATATDSNQSSLAESGALSSRLPAGFSANSVAHIASVVLFTPIGGQATERCSIYAEVAPA
ncbi:MAG TPA: ArdC family protein [Edaphobacter sp.]|nr:ArdC family protein [Edaphobacter sp.]